MYRGGKICLDIHFAPLWAKNTPKFGIAHALAAGVCLYNKIILITFNLVGTMDGSRNSSINRRGYCYLK
jgi:hypothetical protein